MNATGLLAEGPGTTGQVSTTARSNREWGLTARAADCGVPPDVSSLDFQAVIFDMDGVITRTADMHAKAWGQLFETFFAAWNAENPSEPKQYDPRVDYLAWIDGRPRFEAIRIYLKHQGISREEGTVQDTPGLETIGALGNLKNQLFLQLINEAGVACFATTVELVHQLRARSVKVGLVTSSRNAAVVLRSAKVEDLFEVTVDGEMAAKSNLLGKPAPDTFLAAARQLGVSPADAVVVEDAVSGVKAGQQGGFALVVGLARSGNAEALQENGADVVYADFADTDLNELNRLVKSKRALP